MHFDDPVINSVGGDGVEHLEMFDCHIPAPPA